MFRSAYLKRWMGHLVDSNTGHVRNLLGCKGTRLPQAVFAAVLCLASRIAAAAQSYDPAKRDAEFRHGLLQFQVSSTVTNTDKVVASESTNLIYFAEDGRLLHKVESSGSPGEKRIVTFVRGNGWKLVKYETDSSATVVFDDVDPWPRDEDPMFFMTERPCFALASGLGSKSVAALPDSNKGTRIFRLRDGTEIQLTLGVDQLPIEMDREWQGRVVNRWTYEGKVHAAPGVDLPKKSSLHIDLSAGPTDRVYNLYRADLTYKASDNDLNTPWMGKGILVRDLRVTPEADWTFEELTSAAKQSGPIDPIKLLAMSRRRSAAFARDDAAKRARQAASAERSKSSIAIFIGLFLLLCGMLIGGYWLILRLRQPR